jgi:ferredoxin
LQKAPVSDLSAARPKRLPRVFCVREKQQLAYVITEACAGSECLSCLEVCPVDAIHPKPGERGFSAASQLSIQADACIHCASCARVCPLKAAVAGEQPPPPWAYRDSSNDASYQRL